MALEYRGFKLFAIPRAGGHFVRFRVGNWSFRNLEAPFAETSIFATEGGAVREAKRLVDDYPGATALRYRG
jgi:hypothetical protein